MYSRCIFCGAHLGSNDAIEAFAAGRRLAFDSAQGRLWVVCLRCERWCLAPLEERWEAIEECERLYQNARKRAATEQIGLARLDSGLELVGIRQPRRPEFAAWRYGDQFGRRRRRFLLWSVPLGAGAVTGAIGLVGATSPLLLAAAGGLLLGPSGLLLWLHALGASPPMATDDLRGILPRDLFERIDSPFVRFSGMRVMPDSAMTEMWCLRLMFSLDARVRPEVREKFVAAGSEIKLTGSQARWTLGRLLTVCNRLGASSSCIQEAVGELEQAAGLSHYCSIAEQRARARGRGFQNTWNLPPAVRLALEMAVHEESERIALEEGQLADLQLQWQEAEEIAAIADNLLIPPEIEAALRRLKAR